MSDTQAPDRGYEDEQNGDTEKSPVSPVMGLGTTPMPVLLNDDSNSADTGNVGGADSDVVADDGSAVSERDDTTGDVEPIVLGEDGSVRG